MKTEITINYSLPTPGSTSANVLLEQKEWNDNTGYVTKANFIRFMGRLIYGSGTDYAWAESIECGWDAEGITATIYAYPSPYTLPYTIEATYGILSEGIQEIVQQEESIKFSLSKEATIKYPVYEMLDISPLGDFYDRNGNPILFTSFVVTVSGQNIILSQKIYGTIKFKYRSLRYTYTLRLPKRSEEISYENFYSSVVWVGWNGGLRWIEVEIPPGAEEDVCGWDDGGSSVGQLPREPNIPTAAGADRSITIDYCSKEVISDSTYPKTDW